MAEMTPLVKQAVEKLANLADELKKDPGYYLENEIVEAFFTLQQESPADYARQLNKLTKAGGSQRSLEKRIKDATVEKKADSQATLLARLLGDEVEYFQDSNQKGYVTMRVGNHYETHPIRSQRFKLLLAGRFFDEYNTAAGSQAIEDALKVLEARAIFNSPVRKLFTRIGEHNGDIYLDLANDQWQAVKITPEGWQVVNCYPVKFRRSNTLSAIPAPEPGGKLPDLLRFINLELKDWVLIGGWLAASMRPKGPFAILGLTGEQGSAKTCFTRILKTLIDPTTAKTRTAPRDEQDLVIAAQNSWVVAYDNLSGVPGWLSDALCRLSTGGGLTTRKLYTDDEESVFDVTRPIILNGIEAVATRSDLLDRTILIELPTITEADRKTEKEIETEFEAARSMLLGALLDCVSHALKTLPDTTISDKPRMADFALWAVAAEEKYMPSSFIWHLTDYYREQNIADNEQKGLSFISAYRDNRKDGNNTALEHSPVASILIEWFNQNYASTGGLTATPSELHKALTDEFNRQKGENAAARNKFWPQDATRLSGVLKRLTPNLRANGLEIKSSRDGYKRQITIEKKDNKARPI